MQLSSPRQVLSQANQLVAVGQFAEAIKLLYPAVKQFPDFFQGWLLFSRCLFETGHLREAVQIAQHADKIDPAKADFQRIQRCMQQRQYKDAAGLATNILKQFTAHPKAMFTLASVALANDDPEQSISVLAPAITQLPANVTLRKLLCDSYLACGQYAEAISHATWLARLDECFDTLWWLIGMLFRYGQYEPLLERCEQAEALAGGDQAKLSQVALMRGQALRILGRREQSVSCLQASLKADPTNGDAWWALADFKDYEVTRTEQQQLERLLHSNVAARSRCPAAFALAKFSEAGNEPLASIALYHKANQLKETQHYSIDAMVRECESLKQSYTQQALAVQADTTSSQNVPVFIVGLPRSGSTLVEQMLASHAQIEGTLEQPTLAAVERAAQRYCRRRFGGGLLPNLASLTSAELGLLGQAYLDNGALFRPEGCAWFTDKQPFNFRHIGFIHKILPRAVIIDVRRNPMDCGVSLYKQYFHAGVEFSYQLDHIGQAYKAYASLMDHWHSVLSGKVLQVDYEALVAQPEAQIRRILHHIGLQFDPECLNFHRNQRAIHTASSEQVRQPVNDKGIDIWRPVEAELQPLQQSLMSKQ
ncbi:tetratricopeptide repeat-containing sulfotransferase family protein [Alteromonas lipolytica]|uniref:Sulfotransferase n=1 Tax=Alteromonas lipolytica TaxID=1856405 RepID=A0A1E8FBN4_9ALTE|nr:tetratricopeptide repeat-containing sulfotransferase family protein [Alteromonas lipolytica]OFI32913.1 hypothetical protein BFC17_01155 [Alteromonas lipolytica]GGF64260.1 hypothetical protein GCM10011338_15790 [Alteromonas lipolytica]